MSKSVSRMRPTKQPGFFVEGERMLASQGKRIWDIRVGPDGLAYILTDEEEAEPWRLAPASQVTVPSRTRTGRSRARARR